MFEVSDKLVVVQLLERESPNAAELEDAIISQREALLENKRNRLIQTWVEQRRDVLTASGELKINSELVLSGS